MAIHSADVMSGVSMTVLVTGADVQPATVGANPCTFEFTGGKVADRVALSGEICAAVLLRKPTQWGPRLTRELSIVVYFATEARRAERRP
jgi:hypothetical protein